MAKFRQYPLGDLNNVVETINSIPLKAEVPIIAFTVTPTVSVIGFSTTYQTYSYAAVGPVPAMYTHQVNTTLTFTGSATGGAPIVDWAWDFGDGTFGSGQVVTHSYTTLRLGILAHLTATDNLGTRAYASMNLLLVA